MFLLAALSLTGQDSPNVILLFVDDLGWADMGYQNPALHTPNIDIFPTLLEIASGKITRDKSIQGVSLMPLHTSAGPLRGGKYSLFEAGTRVPFITYWEGKIEPKVSDALVCQMDLLSSIAALVETTPGSLDGQNLLPAFMGTSDQGREELVIEATSRTALRKGDWIMIPPYPGRAISTQVNIELGNDKAYQLYNLKDDLGQQTNLAEANPEKLAAMVETFEAIRGVQTGKTEVLKLE